MVFVGGGGGGTAWHNGSGNGGQRFCWCLGGDCGFACSGGGNDDSDGGFVGREIGLDTHDHCD